MLIFSYVSKSHWGVGFLLPKRWNPSASFVWFFWVRKNVLNEAASRVYLNVCHVSSRTRWNEIFFLFDSDSSLWRQRHPRTIWWRVKVLMRHFEISDDIVQNEKWDWNSFILKNFFYYFLNVNRCKLQAVWFSRHFAPRITNKKFTPSSIDVWHATQPDLSSPATFTSEPVIDIFSNFPSGVFFFYYYFYFVIVCWCVSLSHQQSSISTISAPFPLFSLRRFLLIDHFRWRSFWLTTTKFPFTIQYHLFALKMLEI